MLFPATQLAPVVEEGEALRYSQSTWKWQLHNFVHFVRNHPPSQISGSALGTNGW